MQTKSNDIIEQFVHLHNKYPMNSFRVIIYKF